MLMAMMSIIISGTLSFSMGTMGIRLSKTTIAVAAAAATDVRIHNNNSPPPEARRAHTRPKAKRGRITLSRPLTRPDSLSRPPSTRSSAPSSAQSSSSSVDSVSVSVGSSESVSPIDDILPASSTNPNDNRTEILELNQANFSRNLASPRPEFQSNGNPNSSTTPPVLESIRIDIHNESSVDEPSVNSEPVTSSTTIEQAREQGEQCNKQGHQCNICQNVRQGQAHQYQSQNSDSVRLFGLLKNVNTSGKVEDFVDNNECYFCLQPFVQTVTETETQAEKQPDSVSEKSQITIEPDSEKSITIEISEETSLRSTSENLQDSTDSDLQVPPKEIETKTVTEVPPSSSSSKDAKKQNESSKRRERKTDEKEVSQEILVTTSCCKLRRLHLTCFIKYCVREWKSAERNALLAAEREFAERQSAVPAAERELGDVPAAEGELAAERGLAAERRVRISESPAERRVRISESPDGTQMLQLVPGTPVKPAPVKLADAVKCPCCKQRIKIQLNSIRDSSNLSTDSEKNLTPTENKQSGSKCSSANQKTSGSAEFLNQSSEEPVESDDSDQNHQPDDNNNSDKSTTMSQEANTMCQREATSSQEAMISHQQEATKTSEQQEKLQAEFFDLLEKKIRKKQEEKRRLEKAREKREIYLERVRAILSESIDRDIRNIGINISDWDDIFGFSEGDDCATSCCNLVTQNFWSLLAALLIVLVVVGGVWMLCAFLLRKAPIY